MCHLLSKHSCDTISLRSSIVVTSFIINHDPAYTAGPMAALLLTNQLKVKGAQPSLSLSYKLCYINGAFELRNPSLGIL